MSETQISKNSTDTITKRYRKCYKKKEKRLGERRGKVSANLSVGNKSKNRHKIVKILIHPHIRLKMTVSIL